MQIRWEQHRIRLNWRDSGAVRYDPKGPLQRPEHHCRVEDHDLWYFWAGSGTLETSVGPVTVRPGTAIWARPGWTYVTDQDDHNPLGLIFIHFDLIDKLGNISQHVIPPPEHLLVDEPQVTEPVLRWIVSRCLDRQAGVLESEARIPVAETFLCGVLQMLTASRRAGDLGTRSHAPAGELIVRQLCQELQDQLHVAELARRAGYTRQHLNRLFHTFMRMSIAAVSHAVGYPDAFHFSRRFRQIRGFPPSRTPRRHPPSAR